MRKSHPVTTEMELIAVLTKFHIPIETWGQGEARAIEHLFQEIEKGEATLDSDPDKSPNTDLRRTVNGVKIHIFYTPPEGGPRLRLKELKQVYADGRERIRDLDMSIGEKIVHNELGINAVHRAFREELGLVSYGLDIERLPDSEKIVPSKAFPGLVTHFRSQEYRVELPTTHYRAEGYIERQKDKTSYFVWVEDKPNSKDSPQS